MTHGDKNLWQNIIRLCLSEQKTLACAESCTGGWVGKAITDIPGSSGVFLGGVIAYANEIKIRILSVPEKTLTRHGAVSFETCEAMMKSVFTVFSPSYAIAVTGIAGPEGGSNEKPVGTVYIGIGSKEHYTLYHCLFPGNREDIRRQSVQFVGQVLLSLLTNSPDIIPQTYIQRTLSRKHMEDIL